MKFFRCKECNEYKYIVKNSLCRDCLGDKSILRKVKSKKESKIPINIFNNTIYNRTILGTYNRSINIISGIEMLRLKKEYNDLNIFCIDNTGVLSEFINMLDGQIIDLDQNNVQNIKINNDITSYNISDSKILNPNNEKIMELIRIISQYNQDKTVIYIDYGHNFKNRNEELEKIVRRSRHYQTSLNILSNSFPTNHILSNATIERVHSINDPNIAKKLMKIMSVKNKKYITHNSNCYPSTNNPEILIRNPKNNKLNKGKILLSKSEQKLIQNI